MSASRARLFRAILPIVVVNACWMALANTESDVGMNVAYSGTRHLDPGVGSGANLSTLQINPHGRFTLGDSVLMYADGWLRDDVGSPGTTWSRLLETQDRAVVGPREMYIQADADALSLRVGKQVFDWSVTDTVSPTDTLNPRDWTDIVDWERIGIPAVSLTAGTDTYLQCVAALFSVSRMPSESWTEGLPAKMDETDARGEPQLATRAATQTAFGEVGASAMWGRSYAPQFAVRQDADGQPFLEGKFSEQVALTLFGSITAPMGWIVRADAGVINQTDGEDFAPYVAGVERQFGSLLRHSDSLLLILQYAGEFTVANEAPDSVDIQDMRRGLRDSILWSATYSPSDGGLFSLRTRGSVGLAEDSSYVEASTVFAKSDWEATCGVGVFSGAADSFWGKVDDHDRLFLRIGHWF